MFGFKMRYDINLTVNHDNEESAIIFCNLLKQSFGLAAAGKDPNENTNKIAFSMSSDVEQTNKNLQNIQIVMLLLANKMDKAEQGYPKVSGFMTAKPIFKMDYETIGLSSMMDSETKDDFNVVIRDNIFFRPYGIEPMFKNVIQLIKEQNEVH